MRSVRPKFLLVSFFLILFAFTLSAFAVEEKPWGAQYLSEFEGIKVRLASLEQSQRDVLAQKDKILEEIDRVRIWVRHSGSTPKSNP